LGPLPHDLLQGCGRVRDTPAETSERGARQNARSGLAEPVTCGGIRLSRSVGLFQNCRAIRRIDWTRMTDSAPHLQPRASSCPGPALSRSRQQHLVPIWHLSFQPCNRHRPKPQASLPGPSIAELDLGFPHAGDPTLCAAICPFSRFLPGSPALPGPRWALRLRRGQRSSPLPSALCSAWGLQHVGIHPITFFWNLRPRRLRSTAHFLITCRTGVNLQSFAAVTKPAEPQLNLRH
jgi:hypothetical protein